VSPARHTSVWLHVAIILGAVLLVLAPSLFTRDLWNPDEPRYAEIAREMLLLPTSSALDSSGRPFSERPAAFYLFVPHLNGEVYPDKPPVFFWLSALLQRIGLGWGSGRVVSLATVAGTLLLVYALGRRLREPATGLLAALITLTTLLSFYIFRFGVLDPLLMLCTTTSIYAAIRAFERPPDGSPRWWLLCYAAAAVGVLTKGPVALLVPALVALGYGILSRRDARKGGWWHLPGVLFFFAIALTWLLLALHHGGADYVHNIAFGQTLRRVGKSDSHAKPFYFYLLTCPGLFFPWSFLLVLALFSAIRTARRQGDSLCRLAAVWFLVVLVFFSCFPSKRDRYLLPVLPAVGLLCARYLWASASGAIATPHWHRRLWRLTCFLVGLLGISVAAAVLSPRAIAERFSDGPVRLRTREVTDWPGLCTTLRKQANSQEPTPGRSLWKQLSGNARGAIESVPEGEAPDKQARRTIVHALNRLLDSPDFYGAMHSTKIDVPPQVAAELQRSRKGPSTPVLRWINRHALAAAFPERIAPGPANVPMPTQAEQLVTPGLAAAGVAVGVAILAAMLYGLWLPAEPWAEVRRVVLVLGAMISFSLVWDLGATPMLNRVKSARDLAHKASPYLRGADEVYQFMSDFSGAFNLFTGRVRMPVVESRDELAALLASGRRVAVIAREKTVRGRMRIPNARTVANGHIGHASVVVIANWHVDPPNPHAP